jgi:hypothetical protein
VKRFFQNVGYGGAIGFFVIFVISLIVWFLGGTFRGQGGDRIPVTLQTAFQAALMASIFLGIGGALISLARDYLASQKSDVDEF